MSTFLGMINRGEKPSPRVHDTFQQGSGPKEERKAVPYACLHFPFVGKYVCPVVTPATGLSGHQNIL